MHPTRTSLALEIGVVLESLVTRGQTLASAQIVLLLCRIKLVFLPMPELVLTRIIGRKSTWPGK